MAQWKPYQSNETTIVIPENVDHDTREAAEGLMFELGGGFIRSIATGGWRNHEEHRDETELVRVYKVAGLSREALDFIADEILTNARPRQQEVYAVAPDGTAGVFVRSTVSASDPKAIDRARQSNGLPVYALGEGPGFEDGNAWADAYPTKVQAHGYSLNGEREV